MIIFLFIIGTSSLEGLWIVIYPEFMNPNQFRQVDHKILFVDKFGVELHQFHVFQTFYIDC
jgi:hypothetical protein